MTKFLKEHKHNLKKLTKKQLIQQVLIWIDISSHMESQFNDTYEDLMWLYVKQRTELEETQEALRRSRKLFESSKEIIDRQLTLIKRLERGITNTWFISDWCEWITEVLPGWVEEDMIEYKLIDRDQGKYALLLK